jgi:hypothetical protein
MGDLQVLFLTPDTLSSKEIAHELSKAFGSIRNQYEYVIRVF